MVDDVCVDCDFRSEPGMGMAKVLKFDQAGFSLTNEYPHWARDS